MKRYANDPKVRHYLDAVVEQIKFTEAHKNVRRELSTHLEDNVAAEINLGRDEEFAVLSALEKMGDPIATGKGLDSIYRPKVDLVLIAIVVLLNICGLFALSPSGLMGRQLMWMLLGTAIAFAVFKLNYRSLQLALKSSYVFAIFGLMAAHFFGVLYKGQPYLSIFGIGIKIVDVAGCLMAISLPAISELLKPKRHKSLLVSVLTLVPVMYLASTASIIPALLLLISGLISLTKLEAGKTIVVGTGVAGMAAIATFATQGFTLTDGTVAFNDYTDFVLSSLSDNSLSGVVVAIGLLLILVSYSAFSLRSIITPWLQTTATICTWIFAWEIALGIAANFHIIPMSRLGINIPFLSYGGSLIAAHFLLIGVMMNCFYRKAIQYF